MAELIINIEKKDNGYVCEIKGPHKLGGQLVFTNLEEYKMLERVGEAVTGFKVKVERR